MSGQTRYYLTELLMKHNLPMVQGRELVFAEYHDAEIAKLKVLMIETHVHIKNALQGEPLDDLNRDENGFYNFPDYEYIRNEIVKANVILQREAAK